MPDMRGKIVLITGANQGLGKTSAIALGKMGARLVLVCRNAEKGAATLAALQAEGIRDAEVIPGDLASQAAVRQIAEEFHSRHQRLDVLLNNAGVLVPSYRKTVDGLEETLAINHLAYFLLTKLLLDVLKASRPARIVNVSSEAHRGAKMNWDDLQFKNGGYRAFKAYSQSKLCNILFTRELAARLEGTGVTANCLHPGFVSTGFGRTYGGGMGVLVKLAMTFAALNVDDGAKTQIWLASSPDVEGVTGKYFDKCAERLPSSEAQVPEAPARLWAISEALAPS